MRTFWVPRREIASQISQLDAELVEIVQQLKHRTTGLTDMTVRQYVGWQAGLTPAEAARLCRWPANSNRCRSSLPSSCRPPLRGHHRDAGRGGHPEERSRADRNGHRRDRVPTADPRPRLQAEHRTRSDDDRPPPTDSVTYGVRDGRWRLRAELAPELGRPGRSRVARREGSRHRRRRATTAMARACSPMPPAVRRDGPDACSPARCGATASCPSGSRSCSTSMTRDEDGAMQGGGHVDQPSVTEFLCESWITS